MLRAMSAYGMVMGLAAVGGQLLGGALLAADPAGLEWRTVFLINIPVGLGALALVRSLVPESRAAARGRIDVAGTALVTAAVTAIVLPLVEGQANGWPRPYRTSSLRRIDSISWRWRRRACRRRGKAWGAGFLSRRHRKNRSSVP